MIDQETLGAAIGYVNQHGGGGGTSNYNDLSNKPSINDVELRGNKSLEDLGVPTKLKDMTDDSTHRLVTDTEKSTWNGKSDKLSAGDYIDITAGVISVKKEKGEYSLERYVLQSTGGGAPKLVVKKYIDSELISTNEYMNNTAHVNIDDTLEIWYSYNPYNWHYKLLVDGVDHSAGYEYEFSYTDTTEYPVDFHIAAGDSTDLVTKGDLPSINDQTPTFTEASTRNNIASGEKLSVILGKIQKFFNDLKSVAFSGSYADLSNKPQINSVELSGNKTASDLGLAGITDLANKVDKEAGKGLSTNDYTNTDKANVAKVSEKADKTATATGETLSLVPTSEGRALIHTAYGMSVQDGTPTPSEPVDIVSAKVNFRSVGKNLIPYPYTDASGHLDNGITFNYDNSGKLLLSGTNDNINESDITLSLNNHYIKANTHYILSGDTNDDRAFVAVWFTRGKDQSGTISKTVHWILSNDPTIYTESMTNIRTYDSRIAINYKHVEFWLDEDTWVAVTARTVRGNYTLPNNTYLLPMLRLADVTDSTYEPYTKHDTTTDLTLRAIEVTSSDAYNLVRDGKYYIADTIDYSEDNGFVVTRRVGALTFDGSDDTNFAIASNYVSSDKRLIYSNAIIPSYQDLGYSNAWHKGSINSNFLPECIASANQPYNSVETIGLHLSNHNIQLYIAGKSSVVDYMAAFVSNPLNVIYRLATPTTESITTAQALALLGLKTYDESTTISSQAEPACTIAVEYAKERLGALALTAYNTAKGNDLRITALEA